MHAFCSSRSVRSFALGVATLAFCIPAAAWAFDVRGKLEGVNTLTPSAPLPGPTNRRAFYWEEQQIMRPQHPNIERDLTVVLTGPDLAETNAAVTVPVVGGKCAPNTMLVRPNVSFTISNRDWMEHEFFISKSDSNDPISSVPPEVVQSRGTRVATITEAGTYLLRDKRSSAFRCWIVVGNNTGRVISVAPDGTFHTPLADKDYVIKVWFEGRVVAESPAKIVKNQDLALSINIGAPTPPANPAAGTTPAANAAGTTSVPGAPDPGTAPPTPTTPPPTPATQTTPRGGHRRGHR